MRPFTKLPLIISACVVSFLITAKLLFTAFGPRLIINFTDSVPLGVYWLRPRTEIQRGSYVAFMPPERITKIGAGRPWYRPGKYFLKEVAALEGDRVCIEDHELRISGERTAVVQDADRQGVPLPHFTGCITLGDGEVFVMGPDSPWSFDSRYFGPVSQVQLHAAAQLMLRF